MRLLSERKDHLQKAIISESERLAVPRTFDSAHALDLFQLTQSQGLEGIVAKKKDSLYFQGRRTKNWLKMKNLQDNDFVVCGYILKENHMSSIVLGQYNDGTLLYQGYVTLGVGGMDLAKIKAQPHRHDPPFAEVPEGNEDAVWLDPAAAGDAANSLGR